MRKFKTVFMRGGTSRGLIFHRDDLPPDQSEWDSIFLQAMGDPDPKQIDGVGGAVSSNNKIVVVWRSDEPDIDAEYLVGQVVVGKSKVDYRSNCGNMTSAVGPFVIQEGLLTTTESKPVVRLLNRNTDKIIRVTVPVEHGMFVEDGDCHIAGVDGTASELLVNFIDPAGSKTGRLLPTGNSSDVLEIPGFGAIEATLLDVSNPMALVRAEDIGMTATESPAEVDNNERVCGILERVRGEAAFAMGMIPHSSASKESPATPKIGFFSGPKNYVDISGREVSEADMDICVRIISVSRCHKASPLTSACAVAASALIKGTIVRRALCDLGIELSSNAPVRIGHPGGVMTMYADVATGEETTVRGVAVQRTARRIMDGFIYVRK